MKSITDKLKKIKEFTDSMISRGLWDAKAHEDIIDLRDISCHGSEDLAIPACAERVESKKFANSFYCGACSCGDYSHTQLSKISDTHYSKLEYPRVNCPKKMPGFTNYVPLTISENNTAKGLMEGIFGVEYLTEIIKKENSGEQKVE